jgi:ribosome biogenesis ATPase
VIFFDELDALVPKRSSELHEASARVVNTLLTELDGLSMREGIYLIAATNRPEMIDEAMLRPGRLETLLYVELPRPALQWRDIDYQASATFLQHTNM